MFNMAKAGDTYTVTIEKAHLKWGEHRYTDSRGIVYGEGYIKIPSKVAYNLKLMNNNGTGKKDVLGQNLFKCTSVDGKFSCILRAQGDQADDRFAKQFAGNKNLKAVGDWYYSIGAKEGDKVKVTWTSSTDVVIELI